MRKFGFEEYRVHLSTRDPEHPEKYMGSDEEWQRAQNALAEALLEKRIDYREMPGEAVFYGPKIDMNIVDAVGREWQCTTLQFDFNLSIGLSNVLLFVCTVSIILSSFFSPSTDWGFWLIFFSASFCVVMFINPIHNSWFVCGGGCRDRRKTIRLSMPMLGEPEILCLFLR
jgi:hypothetical protein